MKIFRRFVDSGLQVLPDRQFRGIAATSALQSDGWALDMAGCNLDRAKNGKLPFIDNHDPSNVLGVILSFNPTASTLPFLGRFSSEGVSPRADQKYREMKDGVANYFSIGFGVDDAVPIDPKKPYGAQRAIRWTLYELSLATVPVDSDAIVTARARRAANRSSAAMFRNMDAITAAQAHCEAAQAEHKNSGRHQGEMSDSLERLSDHRRSLGTNLRALYRALSAGDSETAIECQGRCVRAADGITRESRLLRDRHDDLTEAHSALMRSLSAAELDGDSQLVQGSGGTGDDQGDRSFRSRQASLRRLAVGHDSDFEHRQRELRVLAR